MKRKPKPRKYGSKEYEAAMQRKETAQAATAAILKGCSKCGRPSSKTIIHESGMCSDCDPEHQAVPETKEPYQLTTLEKMRCKQMGINPDKIPPGYTVDQFVREARDRLEAKRLAQAKRERKIKKAREKAERDKFEEESGWGMFA